MPRLSPSSRRAWIEMLKSLSPAPEPQTSPSSRRAWIEICWRSTRSTPAWVALLAEGVDRNSSRKRYSKMMSSSPSSRRAWIEISGILPRTRPSRVALLAEGVDRNQLVDVVRALGDESPSSRRAWIEIDKLGTMTVFFPRRPPRGGRG